MEEFAPDACFGVSGSEFHDVVIWDVCAECDCGEGVSEEVDPEDLEWDEREGEAEEEDDADHNYFIEVGGEQEADEFFDVAEDDAAAFHGVYDCCEVVVCEDHFTGFFCNICAGDAHGDSDVCAFEGWGVVYAVSGHCYDVAFGFEGFEDFDFVVGADAGVDADFFYDFL